MLIRIWGSWFSQGLSMACIQWSIRKEMLRFLIKSCIITITLMWIQWHTPWQTKLKSVRKAATNKSRALVVNSLLVWAVRSRSNRLHKCEATQVAERLLSPQQILQTTILEFRTKMRSSSKHFCKARGRLAQITLLKLSLKAISQ